MSLAKSTALRASFLIAAAISGLLAVGYARVVALVQDQYFWLFNAHPLVAAAATPLLFLAATWVVRRHAPEARGSGIPQVLEAIEYARSKTTREGARALTSVKTAVVKIVSSLLGFASGASIGREGPTVQLAASAFALVGRLSARWGLRFDETAYLVGGGAAGVAAAFNTPIAGVTFAVEEMLEGAMGPFKRNALTSVVVAGIVAQAFAGNYLYFGHPKLPEPSAWLLLAGPLVGALSGSAGAGFAWILAHPPAILGRWRWWIKSLAAGALCAAIAFLLGGTTAGSGYEVTYGLMSDKGAFPPLFPVGKLVATVVSYHSGMAGGIFAPSLSMGASIGAACASVLHFADAKTCALLGMVGFFSGAIQAPLTGVIIVMEMTDEHGLILPFLLSALIAQRIGALVMKEPLYRHLALMALKRASPQGDSKSPVLSSSRNIEPTSK